MHTNDFSQIAAALCTHEYLPFFKCGLFPFGINRNYKGIARNLNFMNAGHFVRKLRTIIPFEMIGIYMCFGRNNFAVFAFNRQIHNMSARDLEHMCLTAGDRARFYGVLGLSVSIHVQATCQEFLRRIGNLPSHFRQKGRVSPGW